MSANPSCSTTTGAGGGGGGSSSGGDGGPCGACKFLSRKCVARCIFAPYFDLEGATHFAAVHKVFGASNVSKLLLYIPVHNRLDVVVTTCYEAQARLRDPVYGCIAHIFALQQQVVNLRAELSYVQAHLTTLELPTQPPAPPSQSLLTTPPLSIFDLPAASCMPATYDLSSLFDPMVQTTWTIFQPQQRQLDPLQFDGGGGAPTGMLVPSGGGDLQELARELLQRHGSPPQPCTDASALPPHSR